MEQNNNFLGRNGFFWFNAVVESRNDPEKAGRVQIRVLGVHSKDKTVLPTSELPWALCVLPVTSAGISGLGHTPFLVEGTWVFGYFRDGYAQEPVILGTLPGRPIENANTTSGFYDPNGIYPRHINEVDMNRLAVNDEDNPHLALELRKATRVQNVATATFDLTSNANNDTIEASLADNWSQPAIPYNSAYPYNNVFESESGHIKEYDDTPGHQRIFESHTAGTSYEIDATGNKTDIIKGAHYSIVSSHKQALISGNSNTTINGHHKVYINKDGATDNHYDIQVGPNANINIQVDNGDINLHTIQGKINVNSGGDYNLKVGGNMNVVVSGNYTENIEVNKTQNVTGTHIIRGETIDLNP